MKPSRSRHNSISQSHFNLHTQRVNKRRNKHAQIIPIWPSRQFQPIADKCNLPLFTQANCTHSAQQTPKQWKILRKKRRIITKYRYKRAKEKPASYYKRLDDIMTCRCSFTMIVTHFKKKGFVFCFFVGFLFSSRLRLLHDKSRCIRAQKWLWQFEQVNLNNSIHMMWDVIRRLESGKKDRMPFSLECLCRSKR